MNALRSQELVVGCLAASAVVAAGSTLAEGEAPPMRLLVGGTVTAVGLATVSMFNPDLAGSFAVLVLTATVFNYGRPFMDAVTEFTSEPPSRAGRRAPKPGKNHNTTGAANGNGDRKGSVAV